MAGRALAALVVLGTALAACSDPVADDGPRAGAEPPPAVHSTEPAPAAAPGEPRPPAPLRGGFVDDFDGAAMGPAWSWLHDEEGWPDQVRSTAVAGGRLEVEPWTTGWYADFHGPFVFREVRGDFVATARVRARGRATAVPRRTYSLVGLMARAPRAVTPETWRRGGEDHVFVTTGVGERPGSPSVETKSTDDSVSDLALQPVARGWVDLALVRGGPVLLVLFRETGGDWVLADRFDRPDLPATVQLGIATYTDWEGMAAFHDDPAGYHRTVVRDGEPDLRASVDRVAVEPLPGTVDLAGWADADLGTLEAEVARLLPGR